MTTTLSASVVPENEIDALSRLRASLPDGSELGKVLGAMSDGLRSGVGVTVARDDDQLTPARAAAMLGISRTHLYKVLDAGLLPFHVVGERDRRIFMVDVREYLTRTMAFRAADAQSIAKRQQLEDDLLDSME
ncbi:helix-turn-helix domain-containing protein [Arthrobacter sp. 1P04PC]|uniref:helix-turn-helix domain-containing protein n=1 Tax=unclassified Arthrobacter TaxID=235627 RepID=UPI0039A2022A